MRNAIENNNLAEVAELLSSGVDVNLQDESDKTALMYAAEAGRDNMVQLLLAAPGIDVNIQDAGDKTALMYAAELGHDNMAQLLLATPGIDVNLQDAGGETALMYAFVTGNAAIVLLLIEVPGIDFHDFTSLMCAAMAGDIDLVSRLLTTSGVDVNTEDRSEMTALMYALESGKFDVALKLLEVPGIDSKGFTKLMYAAAVGDGALLDKILAIPDAAVNAKDVYDKTALMYAAEAGHLSMVQKLLAVPGLEINANDVHDTTALIYALYNNHIEVADKLLEARGGFDNFMAQSPYDKKNLERMFGAGSLIILELLVRRWNLDINVFKGFICNLSNKKAAAYLMYSGKILVGDNGEQLDNQAAVSRLGEICNKFARHLKKSDGYKFIVKIRRVLSSLLAIGTADHYVAVPYRKNLLLAGICGAEFPDNIINTHTGMSKLKFIWVNSLTRVARLAKVYYGFNEYAAIYILMLHNSLKSVFSVLSDIARANIVELLIGTPLNISICKLASAQSLSPKDLADPAIQKAAPAAAEQDSSQAAKHVRHR